MSGRTQWIVQFLPDLGLVDYLIASVELEAFSGARAASLITPLTPMPPWSEVETAEGSPPAPSAALFWHTPFSPSIASFRGLLRPAEVDRTTDTHSAFPSASTVSEPGLNPTASTCSLPFTSTAVLEPARSPASSSFPPAAAGASAADDDSAAEVAAPEDAESPAVRPGGVVGHASVLGGVVAVSGQSPELLRGSASADGDWNWREKGAGC